MRIDLSLYRPASFIESSFERLRRAPLAGGLLLLLLLGLLFWDWRRLLVSVAPILRRSPRRGSCCTRDALINFMVVAGLVLGLTAVLHDVITDTHRLADWLRRRQQDGGASLWTTVVNATAETRGAVLYAVLVVAAAIVPMLFLGGEVARSCLRSCCPTCWRSRPPCSWPSPSPPCWPRCCWATRRRGGRRPGGRPAAERLRPDGARARHPHRRRSGRGRRGGRDRPGGHAVPGHLAAAVPQGARRARPPRPCRAPRCRG